jgi:hypothetical protein
MLARNPDMVWDLRSYSFAELAGNAALFTGRVATEGVLATESGGDGTLVAVSDWSSRRLETGYSFGFTFSKG